MKHHLAGGDKISFVSCQSITSFSFMNPLLNAMTLDFRHVFHKVVNLVCEQITFFEPPTQLTKKHCWHQIQNKHTVESEKYFCSILLSRF